MSVPAASTRAAGGAAAPGLDTLARQERRFALALLAPALLVLLVTTTVPLFYLAWNSLNRIDLGMPWLSGFAGLENYAKMGYDPRFWNSLWLTVVYTSSTVVLQVALGLSLALLVLNIPKGQGVLRVAAILPIVLAPPEPPPSEGPTVAATASDPAASATAVQAVPPVNPATTAPPERAAAP